MEQGSEDYQDWAAINKFLEERVSPTCAWSELADGRRRKPVPEFENLLQAARAKSIQLSALKAGLLPRDDAPAVDEPARLTMSSAIDDYLEYIRKHRSLRTYRTYRSTLNILGVRLDCEDGLIVEFSDGTIGAYIVEELLELRPIRELRLNPNATIIAAL